MRSGLLSIIRFSPFRPEMKRYGIPFLHAGSFDGHLADYINIRPDVRREFVVLVEF